jgi:hypothetical protein
MLGSSNMTIPEEAKQKEDAHSLPLSLKNECFAVDVHPGHILSLLSIPLLGVAVREYRTPLESLVQEALKRQRVPVRNLEEVEESIRRSVASAVASRALRVATLGSTGAFGLALAGAYYASGCRSTEQAVQQTRDWALRARNRLDASFGVPASSRMDANHPEMRAIRGMTEGEEMTHIQKTYFADFAADRAEEAEDGQSNSR